jgi:hypothetical protein
MSNSDLEIAIGEDAFRAGFEAGLKACKSEGFGTMPEAIAAQFLVEAWDAYTPPDELCGGGPANDSCHVCGGDCGSANPPVNFCPMRGKP